MWGFNTDHYALVARICPGQIMPIHVIWEIYSVVSQKKLQIFKFLDSISSFENLFKTRFQTCLNK